MAQLSQLMKAYNGNWEPDWADDQNKYIIYMSNNKVFSDHYSKRYHFLAFKSEKIRNEFGENFNDLIRQYFMID